MIFSRIFVAVMSIGLVSAAATPEPAEIEKRASVTDVLGIVGTLETAVSGILPQLDSLASSGTATSSSVSPLLAELVSALGTASSSLGGLQGNVKTDSTSAKTVADATAPVLNNIATSLSNVKAANPAIVPLFGTFGIDAAINEVLLGLEVVVAGVLRLLGGLLRTVAGLLGGLGFVLSLLSLGLGIL